MSETERQKNRHRELVPDISPVIKRIQNMPLQAVMASKNDLRIEEKSLSRACDLFNFMSMHQSVAQGEKGHVVKTSQ